jgi:hypothetical protein
MQWVIARKFAQASRDGVQADNVHGPDGQARGHRRSSVHDVVARRAITSANAVSAPVAQVHREQATVLLGCVSLGHNPPCHCAKH